MAGGAFRSAGDAQTPLRLGIVLTVLNVVLNVILIRGLGPIPAFGTAGAAMGTVIAGGIITVVVLWLFITGTGAVSFPRGGPWRPDWAIIRELFRFGLPTGFQGIAMNLGGVFLLRFIGSLAQSAEAQAAYAVGYSQLFSFITWTSVGLMAAAAAVGGQNLGAGKPDRTVRAVHSAALKSLLVAGFIGLLFLLIPRQLLAIFGMTDPVTVQISIQLLRYLSVSGLFVCVALSYTGGLQGTGDTKGPLYISLISQVILPLGYCWVIQEVRGLSPGDIWLAIVMGHVTRAALSILRFRQGKWREIRLQVS
jgi:Na+-driven multidrug efflux pump